MHDLAQQVLSQWPLDGAIVTLAARRENTVWRLSHKGRDFALRLHRSGYRTEAELRSELLWMQALVQGGFPVPEPVPLSDGDLIARCQGQVFSLLTWVPGRPLGQDRHLPRHR